MQPSRLPAQTSFLAEYIANFLFLLCRIYYDAISGMEGGTLPKYDVDLERAVTGTEELVQRATAAAPGYKLGVIFGGFGLKGLVQQSAAA